MSAPDPRQFYINQEQVRSRYGGLSQTSQFMVQLGLYPSSSSIGVERHLTNSSVFDESNSTRTLNFLCSEATLPGSTFDVMELSGARQGIIERMPNRRVYTDFDLTFYVDSDYKTLRLFEEWMNYIDPITNNDGSYQGSSKGQTGYADNNSYYRFSYPNYYKRPILIHKFERNLLQKDSYNTSKNGAVKSGVVKKANEVPIVSYMFLEAFPLNVQAIPLSYEGTDITKVSVNFSYTRYMTTKNAGPGKTASDVAKDEVTKDFKNPYFDEVAGGNFIPFSTDFNLGLSETPTYNFNENPFNMEYQPAINDFSNLSGLDLGIDYSSYSFDNFST